LFAGKYKMIGVFKSTLSFIPGGFFPPHGLDAHPQRFPDVLHRSRV